MKIVFAVLDDEIKAIGERVLNELTNDFPNVFEIFTKFSPAFFIRPLIFLPKPSFGFAI